MFFDLVVIIFTNSLINIVKKRKTTTKRAPAHKEVIVVKATSVLLICLLVFTVVYGLSATLLWNFEEDEDLEYPDKVVLVGDRWPHSPNITFV